jgi:hypothetical protein
VKVYGRVQKQALDEHDIEAFFILIVPNFIDQYKKSFKLETGLERRLAEGIFAAPDSFLILFDLFLSLKLLEPFLLLFFLLLDFRQFHVILFGQLVHLLFGHGCFLAVNQPVQKLFRWLF